MPTIEQRLAEIEARQQQIMAGMGLLACFALAAPTPGISDLQRQALRKMKDEFMGVLRAH